MTDCKYDWCDYSVPEGMEYLFEDHDHRHETLVDIAEYAAKPYDPSHEREDAEADVRDYVRAHGWPL